METETTQSNQPKKASISTGAAIVTAAVIIGLALIIGQGPKNNTNTDTTGATPGAITSVPADVATIRPNDRVRGNSVTAEVAIIEYSDSDCPFCVRFHNTMQQVLTEYDGKVAWVYRYFPLTSLHPNAVTEAVAMECVADLAGNDAFNKYLDQVINVTLSPDPKSNEALTTFATGLGVDSKLFKDCIAGSRASDRVKADTAEAGKIGAQGTPFSIIVHLKTGKQIIVPGAYPIEDIRTHIDSLLK